MYLNILLSIACCLSLACQRQYNHNYWTKNGTNLQNIKWEISLSDSSNILKEQNGIWLIPIVPDSVLPETTITHHIQPVKAAYQNLLNHIDQVLVHDNAVVNREFYHFTKRGAELLGYESSDSMQLLTIYEPPLLVLPADLGKSDSVFFSQANPKTWDATADSFRKGQETRLRFKTIKLGSVLLNSAAVPAVLAKITLSMDGIVGFSGTDLIVPDAIKMQSYILIAENLGTLLEWGVRSRKKETKKTVDPESDPENELRQRFEEREYFIEVILHRKI
jgi:hypothetical protein